MSYINHLRDLEDTCFKQSSVLCVEVHRLLFITTLEFDRQSQEFITSWHSCISCSTICVLPFLFLRFTSFILSHGEFLVGVLRHCYICYLSYCELLFLFLVSVLERCLAHVSHSPSIHLWHSSSFRALFLAQLPCEVKLLRSVRCIP